MASTIKDLSSSAAALYDGGWRASDKDELTKEYALSSDDAEDLCAALRELEDAHYPIPPSNPYSLKGTERIAPTTQHFSQWGIS